MEVKSFISLDEAIRKGIKHKPKLTTKSVSVLDAVGKYSARDILSASDYPAFDRSAVDGYAVKSDETISSSKTNPSTFIIVGTIISSSKNIQNAQQLIYYLVTNLGDSMLATYRSRHS